MNYCAKHQITYPDLDYCPCCYIELSEGVIRDTVKRMGLEDMNDMEGG